MSDLQARERSLADDASNLAAQWIGGTDEQRALVIAHLESAMHRDVRLGLAMFGALAVELSDDRIAALIALRGSLFRRCLDKEVPAHQSTAQQHSDGSPAPGLLGTSPAPVSALPDESMVQSIVVAIQRQFQSFGGIKKGDGLNPLTHFAEGEPATFALGVDIAAVVRFVLGLAPVQDAPVSRGMSDFSSVGEGDRGRHVCGDGKAWTVSQIIYGAAGKPRDLVLVRTMLAANPREWEHTGYRPSRR